jgi:hypothetical protein
MNSALAMTKIRKLKSKIKVREATGGFTGIGNRRPTGVPVRGTGSTLSCRLMSMK